MSKWDERLLSYDDVHKLLCLLVERGVMPQASANSVATYLAGSLRGGKQ